MKKKGCGVKRQKHHASTRPRSTRVYRRDFSAMRAEAMGKVLTPAEQAVWERVHRHDYRPWELRGSAENARRFFPEKLIVL